MKKILVPLLLCLLIASNVSAASAQIGFDRLKQTILTGIDSSLDRLNDIESRIENSSEINATTKGGIINALNTIEGGLLSYKIQVEEATTLEGLRATNQEIIKYLTDSKDVIREEIGEAVIDIAKQAVEGAAELQKKVEQLLKILEIVCPSEKETVIKVEAQLQQLENEIVILQQTIQKEDIPTIKQEIKKISQLSKEIANNLKEVKEACSL